MNYLAHLFLSGNEQELIIGNFIGDYIQKSDLPPLPKMVRNGVSLHHSIDRFTDQHVLVRQGVQRLIPKHGKYATVLLDILYDHLLANQWSCFTELCFDQFSKSIYAVFENYPYHHLLPIKAQKHIEVLIKYKYLPAYKTRIGIQGVLERMDRRARFPSNFKLGIESLNLDFDHFQTEFNIFFEELRVFSKKEIQSLLKE